MKTVDRFKSDLCNFNNTTTSEEYFQPDVINNSWLGGQKHGTLNVTIAINCIFLVMVTVVIVAVVVILLILLLLSSLLIIIIIITVIIILFIIIIISSLSPLISSLLLLSFISLLLYFLSLDIKTILMFSFLQMTDHMNDLPLGNYKKTAKSSFDAGIFCIVTILWHIM